jgi:hypothetical protein
LACVPVLDRADERKYLFDQEECVGEGCYSVDDGEKSVDLAATPASRRLRHSLRWPGTLAGV